MRTRRVVKSNGCGLAPDTRLSKSGTRSSNANNKSITLHTCFGCKQFISDKYLLRACEQFWHENCLKCDRCQTKLGEVGPILYRKSEMNLCRQDYLEMFGQTAICSVCQKLIYASEMVMRARQNVYHLECFACQFCGQRFCVGDRFYLFENKIVCQFDYEEHLIPIHRSLIEATQETPKTSSARAPPTDYSAVTTSADSFIHPTGPADARPDEPILAQSSASDNALPTINGSNHLLPDEQISLPYTKLEPPQPPEGAELREPEAGQDEHRRSSSQGRCLVRTGAAVRRDKDQSASKRTKRGHDETVELAKTAPDRVELKPRAGGEPARASAGRLAVGSASATVAGDSKVQDDVIGCQPVAASANQDSGSAGETGQPASDPGAAGSSEARAPPPGPGAAV